MCGIFGLVRNPLAIEPSKATAVLIELGHLSVERGRDSSGLAIIADPSKPFSLSPAKDVALNCTVAHINNATVIKDTLPFGEFWDDEMFLPLVSDGRIIIGHTRWATQGASDDIKNASPFAINNLIGTHNGDVDTTSVGYTGKTIGSTDTEELYRKIDEKKSHRANLKTLLEKVEGRMALAWYDARLPHRLYLARAGQSPLSVAYDQDGNFYWASNPDWFRRISKKFNNAVQFTVHIIQEGTLMTVNAEETGVTLPDIRQFNPIVRHSDSLLGSHIIFRGFETQDIEIERANKNHKVAARKATYGKYSGHWGVTTSKTTTGFTANPSTTTTSGSPSIAPQDSSSRWDSEWEAYSSTPNPKLDAWDDFSGELTQSTGFIYEDDGYDFEDLEEGPLFDELISGELEGSLSEIELQEVNNAIDGWIDTERSGRITDSHLEPIYSASSDKDFENVAKSWGLPTKEAAKMFVASVRYDLGFL